MEVSTHGYWVGYDAKEHRFDVVLAESILKLAQINNFSKIMDVGCGLGEYVRYFDNGGMICYGYDGNPETMELNSMCKVLDFAVPVSVKPAELVLSLEVGEHIPSEFEDAFIYNLTIHAQKMLILSWALPGQGGYGHVNCKSNESIIDKVQDYGLTYNGGYSAYLRLHSTLSWFKDTIMVFGK